MGVSVTLVKGGTGQSPAGEWGTPTKTMFQLEPVQLFQSLLREIHCCCVPESTLPSTRVSDIHPPDAQPCCWLRTRLPRMWRRRMGTACETAHCMVPSVGVTAKVSAARQEGVVAVLWWDAGSTWTLPEKWVASGVAPRPATSV